MTGNKVLSKVKRKLKAKKKIIASLFTNLKHNPFSAVEN